MAKCRSCEAEIYFLTTNSGSKMPVDGNSVDPGEKEHLRKGGDIRFDRSRHTSHFSTCTNASKFRKTKKVKNGN